MEIIASDIGEVKFFEPNPRRLRVDLATTLDQPGRFRVCLNEGSRRGVDFETTNYLGFMCDAKGIRLSGMWVRPQERGKGMGGILLETGFRVAESVGSAIKETMIMRKPLIAQAVSRFGFKPTGDSTVVQFTQEKGSYSTVPRVRMQTAKSSFNHPCASTWFELEEGPLVEGFPVIPIFTTYKLEDREMHQNARDEVLVGLNGRIRVYPNRIQAVLSSSGPVNPRR